MVSQPGYCVTERPDETFIFIFILFFATTATIYEFLWYPSKGTASLSVPMRPLFSFYFSLLLLLLYHYETVFIFILFFTITTTSIAMKLFFYTGKGADDTYASTQESELIIYLEIIIYIGKGADDTCFHTGVGSYYLLMKLLLT